MPRSKIKDKPTKIKDIPSPPYVYETTLGYMEWRRTVTPDDLEDLFVALTHKSTEELHAAYERLLSGLAAERLNPSESRGDFHYAARLIEWLLYQRGHRPSHVP